MNRELINSFWNHFKKNNFAFLLIKELPAEELEFQFNTLNHKLAEYNEHLGLIIKNGKSKSELIITAHGNPYLFKEVELLVHYAPKIDRWKITAFLQPEQNITKYEEGTDKPFQFYGVSLKVSEMYFEPLENPKKPEDLGIRVYINNYKFYKDSPKLREAVYIQMEHLLGEKSFANDLSFIDITQIPITNKTLFELCYLSSFIEDFNNFTKQ
jgi:hypothetical protein